VFRAAFIGSSAAGLDSLLTEQCCAGRHTLVVAPHSVVTHPLVAIAGTCGSGSAGEEGMLPFLLV
jgi:hypothetical protein